MREHYLCFYFIYVLPARTAPTCRLNFNVSSIYLHIHFFGFRKNGNRYGRCMNSSLLFGGRNALHAVNSAFKFQRAVCIIASNFYNYLFKSAQRARSAVHRFILESFFVEVARVHAIEIAYEQTGFISSCSRTDLYDSILCIFGVLRDQELLEMFFHMLFLRSELLYLRL